MSRPRFAPCGGRALIARLLLTARPRLRRAFLKRRAKNKDLRTSAGIVGNTVVLTRFRPDHICTARLTRALVEELLARDLVLLADGVDPDFFQPGALAARLGRDVEREVDRELVRIRAV